MQRHGMERLVNDKLKIMRKEAIAAYFKVIQLKLPGETKENNGEP
jgi:hypothetical protein